MKKYKLSSVLYYVSAALFYITAIIYFVGEKNNSMGTTYLCLGSAFLCFGSLYLKKSKPADEDEKTLPLEALKWNKMWDMWADGQIESPYQDLMTYQSEVNNGGHSQFFFNVENTGDINAVVKENLSILPDVHKRNLEEAYSAYKKYNDVDDDKMDEILDGCDDIFYENEELINEVLEKRAESIEL